MNVNATCYRLFFCAAALGCGLTACDSDDTQILGDGGGGTSVSWTLQGLDPLGDDYVYEGWIIVDGSPVSTGRFNVESDGSPGQSTASITSEQAAGATKFVLTIEPAVGDDPAPADTKLLAGDFAAGQASLSVTDPAALGTDFLTATGQYILETPSSAAIADDYTQGIWWLVPPTPNPGLVLPTLPAGWSYEGWVVDSNGPVSTGRFTTATGADSDGAGATAGSDATPAFPGQDFITPARNLVGQTAVISVEPEPDDSSMPFALKPLVHVIADAGAGVAQTMDNNASASNPTGSATITP